jgi:hypothetical protein
MIKSFCFNLNLNLNCLKLPFSKGLTVQGADFFQISLLRIDPKKYRPEHFQESKWKIKKR